MSPDWSLIKHKTDLAVLWLPLTGPVIFHNICWKIALLYWCKSVVQLTTHMIYRLHVTMHFCSVTDYGQCRYTWWKFCQTFVGTSNKARYIFHKAVTMSYFYFQYASLIWMLFQLQKWVLSVFAYWKEKKKDKQINWCCYKSRNLHLKETQLSDANKTLSLWLDCTSRRHCGWNTGSKPSRGLDWKVLPQKLHIHSL